MSDFIAFSERSMFSATVEALQEGKRLCRNLENICDTLGPLLAQPDGDVAKRLEEIRESAAKAARTFQLLYTKHARLSFGAPVAGPTPRGGSSVAGVSEGLKRGEDEGR